jgi:MinD superfamily P-loop ATPase
MGFQYLKDVVTLELDADKCTLCGMCTKVCVHGVFALDGNGIQILDRNYCMECGACAMNCPAEAVTVRAGVGCAWAIFNDWFKKTGVSKHQAACSKE